MREVGGGGEKEPNRDCERERIIPLKAKEREKSSLKKKHCEN